MSNKALVKIPSRGFDRRPIWRPPGTGGIAPWTTGGAITYSYPGPTVPQFFIRADGKTSSSGKSRGEAWNGQGLINAIAAGNILPTNGVWVNRAGVNCDIGTMATVGAKDAGYSSYLGKDRYPNGYRLLFDPSAGPITIPGQVLCPPGGDIRSLYDNITPVLWFLLPLNELWVNVSGNVWVSTNTTYSWVAVYEQVTGGWGQYTPVQATTAASATIALQALTTGGFWTSAGTNLSEAATGKLYIRMIGGGNPNMAGIALQYAPAVANGQATPLFEVSGCRTFKLGGFGGFNVDSSNLFPVSQYLFSDTDGTKFTIKDGVDVLGGFGKHSHSWVGNTSSGFMVHRNCTSRCGPAGLSTANWSHWVHYNASGNGTGYWIMDTCTTLLGVANIGAAGGTEPASGYIAVDGHGGGTSTFVAAKIINCVLNSTSPTGATVPLLTTSGNRFTNLFTASGGTWNSSGDTFMNQLPGMDGGVIATINDPIVVANTLNGFSSTPTNIYCTVTINRGSIDVTAASGFTGTWTRQAPQIITINGAPTGGTFTLTYKGQTTTATAFNAAASTVQTNLAALSTIGANNVSVLGNNGGPYTVSFINNLTSSYYPLLIAASSLTGGSSPTVSVVDSVVSVTLNGTTFKSLNSPTFGIFNNWIKTDVFAATGLVYVGANTWGLFGNYLGAGLTYSWQWARDMGMIDVTSTLNGATFTAPTPMLVSDRFIAVNGTAIGGRTPDIGPAWTNRTGYTPTINAYNQATIQNSTGSQDYSEVTLANANITETFILAIGTASNLNLRQMYNESNTSNYWMTVVGPASCTIYSNVAGAGPSPQTPTTGSNAYSVAFADNSRHTVQTVTNGDTVTVFIDGVQQSSFTTAGRGLKANVNAGFGCFGGNASCNIEHYFAQ